MNNSASLPAKEQKEYTEPFAALWPVFLMPHSAPVSRLSAYSWADNSMQNSSKNQAFSKVKLLDYLEIQALAKYKSQMSIFMHIIHY